MIKFEHFYKKVKNDTGIIEDAFAKIKNEANSKEVGYYTLMEGSLSLLEEVKKIDNNFSQIVVVGIGGSSLGIRAIYSLLKPLKKEAKEIIFFENSDPITISQNLAKIKPQDACFFIISKSGSTIETTSIFKTIIKHFDLKLTDAKNIFVITDEDSSLSKFAKHYNIGEFFIPHNVGGRFSVFSAVGVAPLLMAGFDVKKILEGAKEFRDSFFNNKENHLLQKAYYQFIHANTQKINIIFAYSNLLEDFTKWFVQLWGESLGKIDKSGNSVGLTPIGLIGAIDQHSFLQLIIEGPRDKNVTFIRIEDFQNDLKIPNISLKFIEKTNFVNNKTFATLINEQAKATMQSVINCGIDCDSIVLNKIDEKNIGKMIIYYELLTSLVGAMFNINTYNQPGVELGKEILYKNLGQ